jgi:hypothetical protein
MSGVQLNLGEQERTVCNICALEENRYCNECVVPDRVTPSPPGHAV